MIASWYKMRVLIDAAWPTEKRRIIVRKKANLFNTINMRIMLAAFLLFILVAVVIGAVNSRNIRNLYAYSRESGQRILLHPGSESR